MTKEDDWMLQEMKKMVKTMLPFWIGAILLFIGGIIGTIGFIFWCLKHFGLI